MTANQEGTEKVSFGDVYYPATVGVLAKKVPEWTMTITPSSVTFQVKEGKQAVAVPRNQANRKISFPDSPYRGRGKLQFLDGRPQIAVGEEALLFSNKQVFVVTPEAHDQLREWVPPITRGDLKSELRRWGVGLIILGVLHFVLAQFLSPAWGTAIIVLGVVNLLVAHPSMFVVNGLALVVVGGMNVISGFSAGVSSFWATFGILQIIWGIREMVKVSRYAEAKGGMSQN